MVFFFNVRDTIAPLFVFNNVVSNKTKVCFSEENLLFFLGRSNRKKKIRRHYDIDMEFLWFSVYNFSLVNFVFLAACLTNSSVLTPVFEKTRQFLLASYILLAVRFTGIVFEYTICL